MARKPKQLTEEENNMKRESVLIYRSQYKAIKEIDDPAERAKCYEAILEYGLDREEPEGLEGIPKIVFIQAKPQIDANHKKYIDGLKGGAPEGNQNARKNPEALKEGLREGKTTIG